MIPGQFFSTEFRPGHPVTSIAELANDVGITIESPPVKVILQAQAVLHYTMDSTPTDGLTLPALARLTITDAEQIRTLALFGQPYTSVFIQLWKA